MERIVDTHCHFWSRAASSWLDGDYGAMERDWGPDDHRARSAPEGVSRCVIVEAGSTDAENQHIIDIAARDDIVGGLILWAPAGDPQFAARLDRWQRLPKFRGVRMGFEQHPDADIARQPAVVEQLKELARRGLIHDFLPLVRHLDDLAATLERVPDLHAIIEHYAKPDFDGTFDPAWERAMRRMAENTNVRCKLSLSPQVTGMKQLAAATPAGWPVDAIRPYTQLYLEAFGTDRLMWGSDWPVVEVTTTYTGMLDTHRQTLGVLDPVDEAKLFRTNAEAIYRLEA